MNNLRATFPIQIVRGALLRSDGIAVGLVSGGAPAWDLLSLAAQSKAGDDYHRLLLALNAPIDIYVVDQPPDIQWAVATVLARQQHVAHALLAGVLAEMADYLTELGQYSSSRAKQVIWAVTSGTDASTPIGGGVELARLIGHGGRNPAARANVGQAALTQALEQARRLADALTPLGASPPPRLMEAEEIAQLIYRLADPVRSQRYPLAGSLFDRVRRIVTTSTQGKGAAHEVA
jgi:hypothetical protein